MRLGDDFYDSFVRYQRRVLREFDKMAKEFNFTVIDASDTYEGTNIALKKQIGCESGVDQVLHQLFQMRPIEGLKLLLVHPPVRPLVEGKDSPEKDDIRVRAGERRHADEDLGTLRGGVGSALRYTGPH